MFRFIYRACFFFFFFFGALPVSSGFLLNMLRSFSFSLFSMVRTFIPFLGLLLVSALAITGVKCIKHGGGGGSSSSTSSTGSNYQTKQQSGQGRGRLAVECA